MSGPRWLIVRFGALGDCLMACWTATAIRDRYPDGQLVWAVEARCAGVIPVELARVEAFARPRRHGYMSPAAWVRQYRCYARLRAYRFDVGLDLHGHLKTAFCLRLARPRERWAFRATDALAARLNPLVRLEAPPEHEVERQLALLCKLGPFEAPARPRGFARSVQDPRLATVMTGASDPTKAISVRQAEAICSGLRSRGYRVAVVGGPDDPNVTTPDVESLVGRLDVPGTLARVAASAVHIAPDTWTGHAAAACGVPVVSLFGRGKNRPERFRPYTSASRLLRADHASEVAPEAVLQAVADLVGSPA